MSIVTRTGDKGETGLYGAARLPKDHPRIEAYGTVDELNACIGVVLSLSELSAPVRGQLTKISHLLFRVGGDLATPMGTKERRDRIGVDDVHMIEIWIVELETALPPQTAFILPGGSQAAAHLHLARTICRRAERRVVTVKATEEINEHVLIFLNRLSDYLFLIARRANADSGVPDTEVQY